MKELAHWQASIRLDNALVDLGSYQTCMEAAIAFTTALQILESSGKREPTMNDTSKTKSQTFDKALKPSIERSTGMHASMHTNSFAHPQISQAILNTDQCLAM